MELHIYVASRLGQQPLIYYLLILSFSQYALAQSGRHSSSPTDSSGLILLAVGAMLFFGCFLPLYIIRNCLGSTNTTTAITDPPDRINTNRGVDQKVIETFPLINYDVIKHMRASNSPLECAICLIEFLIDDILQLLPGCRHVFHVNCIDTWLAEHKTCPVCRSNLSDPKVIASKRLLSLKIESEDVPCSSSYMSEQVATKMDVMKSKGPKRVQSMPRGLERFTLILPDDVTKDIKTSHKYRKTVSFQDYSNKGNAGTDREIPSFMNSLSWNRQQKGKSKVSAALEMTEASNSANISSRKLLALSDQGEKEMLEMDSSWTQIELENLPAHDRV